MKYPRYPVYKDSGVEWVGEIPEHWEVRKLKHIVEKFVGGATPSTNIENYWDGSIHWVAISDVTNSSLISNTERRITELGMESKQLSLLKAGTILYSMYASVGKVAQLLVPATTNQAVVGLVNSETMVLNQYLKFSLESFEPFVGFLFSSNTQNNINEGKVRNISIPVPNHETQKAILKFLKARNATIEILLNKLTKMIELLQEKRQAIITHAVTKGLDPNVPMKDSGVEWIGGMPEQWKILQLKRVMSCNDEVIPENTSPDEELAYVEISDVDYPKGITDVKVLKFKNSPSRARRKVREGDIIISTVRTYLKAIAEIRNPPINMVVSTGFAVLRPRNIQQTFAKYVLSSKYFLEMTISESIGVGYPAINTDKLISIKIPVPNNDTQSKINEFLDHEIYKIDSLEFKLQKMTNILNDYRSSLISAAVTGKIDVRNIPLNESSRPELNDR